MIQKGCIKYWIKEWPGRDEEKCAFRDRWEKKSIVKGWKRFLSVRKWKYFSDLLLLHKLLGLNMRKLMPKWLNVTKNLDFGVSADYPEVNK